MKPIDFKTAEFEKSYGTSAQLPPSTMPEIVFAGRSNVGKSSLLNKLVGQKALARVSQRPGETKTINFFRLKGVRLVDLPGYGFAKVSKKEHDRWSELIGGYFGQDRKFALVCSLVDIRHPASDLDIDMVAFLREQELPFAIILTKGDKLSRTKCLQQQREIAEQLGLPEGTPCIITSAAKGDGIKELQKLIAEAVR